MKLNEEQNSNETNVEVTFNPQTVWPADEPVYTDTTPIQICMHTNSLNFEGALIPSVPNSCYECFLLLNL